MKAKLQGIVVITVLKLAKIHIAHSGKYSHVLRMHAHAHAKMITRDHHDPTLYVLLEHHQADQLKGKTSIGCILQW